MKDASRFFLLNLKWQTEKKQLNVWTKLHYIEKKSRMWILSTKKDGTVWKYNCDGERALTKFRVFFVSSLMNSLWSKQTNGNINGRQCGFIGSTKIGCKDGWEQNQYELENKMSALAFRRTLWYAGSISARHKSHMNDFNGSGGYQVSSEFYSLLKDKKKKKKNISNSFQNG